MRIALPIIGAALLAACASKPRNAPALTPLPARPLAEYATRPIIVLPTQYLRPADSLGWAASIGRPREYLHGVDDEIAFALGERGVKERWIFPDALARSARRNAGFAADPYALGAEFMRPPWRPPQDELLPDPLASQLRALVALHDARYALLPIEIRFEKAGGGTGRAVLRLALIDARGNQVLWMRDVRGDSTAAFSPALAASIGSRVADLVAAP